MRFGTAVYCGLGQPMEKIKAHLEAAARAGMTEVFSSVQLPESNKEQLLRELPEMAAYAHKLGLKIDADIGQRTADLFGLDLKDLKAFKDLGIDIMRLDYGYTQEETAAISHNSLGITIELNACYHNPEDLRRSIQTYEKYDMNKQNVRFCHNYYPMPYTGITPKHAAACNAVIHEFGYEVGGFLASQTHQRIACSQGLPTVERHRKMNAFAAAQEAKLLGFDNLFFGDDLADESEMKLLCSVEPDVITLRVEMLAGDDMANWLIGREMNQMLASIALPEIIRSNFGDKNTLYPGDYEGGIRGIRHKGDVTVCKAFYQRYAGEIQLDRMDLPEDPNMRIVARIIPEDIPVLELFDGPQHFRLIRA